MWFGASGNYMISCNAVNINIFRYVGKYCTRISVSADIYIYRERERERDSWKKSMYSHLVNIYTRTLFFTLLYNKIQPT